MPGPNESGTEQTNEELLASTNMRDLLQVSPEGIAALDAETDGAASKFRALVEKAAQRDETAE